MKEISFGRPLFYLMLWVFGIIVGSDYSIILLTLPLFGLILWQVSSIKQWQFSSEDIFWFCVHLFFVVGPCQSFSNGSFYNTSVEKAYYDTKYLIMAQSIVLVSVISFIIGRKIVFNSSSRNLNKKQPDLCLSTSGYVFLFSIACLSFIFYVFCYGGIGNVLLPRSFKDQIDVRFGVLSVLSLATLFMSAFLLSKNVSLVRHKFKSEGVFFPNFVLGLVLLMLVVCVNPFNIPRFFFVATWLPILIVYLGNSLRYYFIYLLLVIGILVVMPLMSLSTRGGSSALSGWSDSGYSERLFFIKDVDVFDTLVHCVAYVDVYGFMYGSNVMAILLFFVPRYMWPTKPIVGGLIIGDDLYQVYGAGTSNLSFYIGGDFYMDFGFIGVFLGFIFLGFMWTKLRRSEVRVFGEDVLQYVLLGSIPILLRGPVGAVEGYFWCQFAMLIVFSKIFSFSGMYKISSPMRQRIK